MNEDSKELNSSNEFPQSERSLMKDIKGSVTAGQSGWFDLLNDLEAKARLSYLNEQSTDMSSDEESDMNSEGEFSEAEKDIDADDVDSENE